MVEASACGCPLILPAPAVLEQCLELERQFRDVFRALATPGDGRNQPDVHRPTGTESRAGGHVARVLDPDATVGVLLHHAADVPVYREIDNLPAEVPGVRLHIRPAACEVDPDWDSHFDSLRHGPRQISGP